MEREQRDEETVREEVVMGGAAEVAADASKAGNPDEGKGERGGESERMIGRDEDDPEAAGIEESRYM